MSIAGSRNMASTERGTSRKRSAANRGAGRRDDLLCPHVLMSAEIELLTGGRHEAPRRGKLRRVSLNLRLANAKEASQHVILRRARVILRLADVNEASRRFILRPARPTLRPADVNEAPLPVMLRLACVISAPGGIKEVRTVAFSRHP